MNYTANVHTFTSFVPGIIDIDGLLNIHTSSNLIIYGEIHGAVENAHIVYTLCRKLNVSCLAVEYSSNIHEFIKLAVADTIDFSLLDTTMFDRSILSLEMLKTIVELLRTGAIKQIKYIDGTFDYKPEQLQNLDPESREKHIADNITKLDVSIRTLCILGNWHTRPRKTDNHISALIWVRKFYPNAVLIYNRYRKGSIRNAGTIIKLRTNNKLSDNYSIRQKAQNNYDLTVPIAHPIEV